MTRTPEQQAAVDTATSRYALYEFGACPYCRRVRRVVHRLALDITGRDVRRDPAARAELVASGGRFQVPALRIEGNDGDVCWLYESSAIIEFLQRRFGQI